VCFTKPTILRRLIGDNQSIGPNDEILAGGFHHFFGDKGDLVGDQNMFDLHHQALNQANIASRQYRNQILRDRQQPLGEPSLPA
jgi:hypothetical protein